MPFTCDVCGDEVSYSERVFKLRNGAEIVICSECLKDDEDEEIMKIPVKDRTEEQHQALIKIYGGVRKYLLSMGKFKEVKIKEEI